MQLCGSRAAWWARGNEVATVTVTSLPRASGRSPAACSELAQQVATRMDGDGALTQRFLRRQHGGQLLVLHAEQAHRRRGDIEALGHHRRHAVTGEADGLGEQRLVLWAVLVRQKTVTAVETLRGVLVREHGDARQGQRLGRIARQPHVGRVQRALRSL